VNPCVLGRPKGGVDHGRLRRSLARGTVFGPLRRMYHLELVRVERVGHRLEVGVLHRAGHGRVVEK
jgi:hypothetical protein